MRVKSATAPLVVALCWLRRRIASLHRSTWVVVAMIAAGLVFANIPGRMDVALESSDLGSYRDFRIDHGWPWPFLRRTLEVCQFPRRHRSDGERLGAIEPGELWALARNIEETDLLCLAEDVGVAVVAVALGAALFELWRRCRYHVFQFYLIELFGLMTALCLLFSWLVVESRDRREEQEALRRMENIHYVEEAAGPHWLRGLVGPRLFQSFDHVRSLSTNALVYAWSSHGLTEWESKCTNPEEISHLRHLRCLLVVDDPVRILSILPRPERLERLTCRWPDEDLVELRRCRNLQALTLYRPRGEKPITERGMAALETLTNLRLLELDGVAISGAGLAHLAKLSRLEVLRLIGPSALDNTGGRHSSSDSTELGLRRIAGLPKLRSLGLHDYNLSDRDLRQIARLKGLSELHIEGDNITDEGLENLAGLTKLQTLELAAPRITDAGLRHLKGLAKLQALFLYAPQVTDAGLQELKGLTQLRSLEISRASITAAGIRDLQKAMPKLTIRYWGG
jgi:hypothetical protein